MELYLHSSTCSHGVHKYVLYVCAQWIIIYKHQGKLKHSCSFLINLLGSNYLNKDTISEDLLLYTI